MFQVNLDIDTGAGNHAIVSKVGTFGINFQEFWLIAGLGYLANYHNVDCLVMTDRLTTAIEFMHDNPQAFGGFMTPLLRDYDRMLEFTVKLRNECLLHPLAQVNCPSVSIPQISN